MVLRGLKRILPCFTAGNRRYQQPGPITILLIVIAWYTIVHMTYRWVSSFTAVHVTLSSQPYSMKNMIRKTPVDIDDVVRNNFYFARYDNLQTSYFPKASDRLEYSETLFRSLESVPILWIDSKGDTRWNKAAEQEMYLYLLKKQTIETTSVDQTINECLRRQLIIIKQHEAGFFSRHLSFIEQFGQTLYSPLMALLSYRAFHVSGAQKEDFRGEGVLRYFVPMSTCAKFDQQQLMRPILQRLRGDFTHTSNISSIHDLLYENQRQRNARFIWLESIWTYGYEHIPHRRWMLDINRSWGSNNYSLSIDSLLNHSAEHIYHAPSLSYDYRRQWHPRNGPYGYPTTYLNESSKRWSWRDQIFTSFLRYMFTLYFHHFPSRIYLGVHLLAEHWSNYLFDKSGQTLNDMAAIFIRRGDKMPEDSFWIQHHRWRNISLYVKSIVDEEQKQNRHFSSIFVLTDDVEVMKSMYDYADPLSPGTDEPYARKHLQGRHILHNVFAPQPCFIPFIRIGFDEFLVSMEFVVQYSQFTVSHTDSNVGRYLEQIVYARRQLNDTVHSKSFIVNAPDSF